MNTAPQPPESTRAERTDVQRDPHGQYLRILDQLDAIVYVADMDTHEILYANGKTRQLFGADIVGKTCWETLQKGQTGPCPFCNNDRLVDDRGRAAGTLEWEFENTLTRRWYLIKDQAIPWTDGRLVRLEIATNITARKRSETMAAALQKLSHALWIRQNLEQYYADVHAVFRQHMGAENFFVALTDRKNDRIVFPYYADETRHRCFEIRGLSTASRPSLTVSVIRTARPLFIRKADIEARRDRGEIAPVGNLPEIWLGVPLKTGEQVIGAIAVQNYQNAQAFSERHVDLMVSVAEMIAVAIERHQSAVALTESEERHRALSQATFEAIFICDAKACIETNQAAEDMFGYASGELVGIFGADLIAPESRKTVPNRMPSGDDGPCEILARRKDGTVFPAEFRSKTFTYKGKTIQATAVRDLTERKQAETRMQESMATLESIFRAAPTGIGMVIDRVIMKANDRLCQMVGYAARELIGQSARILYPDEAEFRRVGTEKYAEIRTSGTGSVETRWRTKDGRIIDVLLNSTPLDAADLKRGVTFTALDITQRKRLEEQLRQAQKMEAIGQLAGGIAHDFNNLLQVINGYAGLLHHDLGETHPARNGLNQILKAGDRAKDLVRQLLAFGRQQVMQMKVVDVNDLIGHLLIMIRRVIGEHIELNFTAAPTSGTVWADPGQIEQVLMNLCVNARDAMPDGGRLTIETCRVEPEETPSTVTRSGPFVRISVIDTGIGMDANIQHHIFDPFFTTKTVGKGTGLGLATAFGILKQHEGWIDVNSMPGSGSRFDVYLPACDFAMEKPVPKQEGLSAGGTETILLAEDDAMVREFAAGILEMAGYTVITADDGKDATEKFRAQPDRIDLALLDVVMPGRSGREVHDVIRKTNPTTRILFSSGYSQDAISTNFVLDNGMALIQKPYRRDALLAKIREMLDRD